MTALPTALLGLPAPGESLLAQLRARVRVLAARRLVPHGGHGLPCGLERVQWSLARLSKSRADALLEAVGTIDVLAPLLALESGAIEPGASMRAAVPPLLVALADALGEPVRWTEPYGLCVDRARSAAFYFEPSAHALEARPGAVIAELASGERVDLRAPELTAAGVRHERPFHQLRPDLPGVSLSELDTNPLALDEAHPDKSGNAFDLGGRTTSEWVRALGEALELVRIALPCWYAELPVALERIVPVGWDEEKHLSASYREAPGLVYMTLHPDPLTMAEAIVHEVQHGKLNLFTWLDPVLENAYTTWTESPVRPDLRPVMGVLLAVHAFVPVAALHRELARLGHPIAATQRFAARRAQVLAGNARGLAIVREKGAPTAGGRRMLDDLARLHDLLAAEVDAPAPATRDDALPG